MKNADDRNSIMDRIRSHGLRLTVPRKCVVDLLLSAETCLTAEEIYFNVHADHPGIGLTTIYRTLALLSRLGELIRIEAGDGRSRYELSEPRPQEHHHHLICTTCHRVQKYSQFSEEERTLMSRTEAILEARFSYQITGHTIYFHGICPECRKRPSAGGGQNQ